MKGLIVLDIDGTVTDQLYEIDPSVLSYLKSLYEGGWQIFFVTGRTFAFSKKILQSIPFPFFAGVQNGSAIIRFPEQKIFHMSYLHRKAAMPILKFLFQEKIPFVVECGFNVSDICYYFPNNISKEERDYIEFRISIAPETWIALDSIDEISQDTFPVIKYFCKYQNTALQISEQIANLQQPVNTVTISDPFNRGTYLAHITSKEASKSSAVEKLRSQFSNGAPLIVAGDDYNDKDMLLKGDVKVVMETAPQDVLDIADIIAPSANERGIIRGLTDAIEILQRK